MYKAAREKEGGRRWLKGKLHRHKPVYPELRICELFKK